MSTNNDEIRKQYYKERKRVTGFVNRARKKGFIFPDDIIPKIPKKITPGSIIRLQKLTPEYFYKKAYYADPETGEALSGTEGLKIRRKQGKQKDIDWKDIPDPGSSELPDPREEYYGWRDGITPGTGESPETSYAVIEEIRDKIRSWMPDPRWAKWKAEAKEHDKNQLEAMLEGAIQTEGYDTVAKRLEESAREANAITDNILYGSGDSVTTLGATEIDLNFAQFASILKGAPITQLESEALTDYFEYLEGHERL